MIKDIKKAIKSQLPEIRFIPSDKFYWTPETKTIYYDKKSRGNTADLALLHEIGHAKLNHKVYSSDFNLIQLELEAWEEAKQIAKDLGIKIDLNHIEDCLDTYRDWMAKRSQCPGCGVRNLQQTNSKQYSCYNCRSKWKVTPSRFCRPYRAMI